MMGTYRLQPTNAYDIVTNTSLAYQSGPLGDFYQGEERSSHQAPTSFRAHKSPLSNSMIAKHFKIVLFNLSILTFLASQSFAQHRLPSFSVIHGQTEVSPVVEGYRLTISTTNTFFKTNQALELTISIQNVSTNGTYLGAGTTLELYYSFTVTGPHGKVLNPNEVGQHFLAPPFISTQSEGLGPGNTYVLRLPLDWMYDLKEPGEYSVTVARSVEKRSDPNKKVYLTSPPLKFQILGPNTPSVTTNQSSTHK